MPSKQQDEWFSHPSIDLDLEKLLEGAGDEPGDHIVVEHEIPEAPIPDHDEPVRPEPPVRPAPSPAPSVSGMPILKQGSSGPAVQNLQTLLNKNGASLNVDGDFGSKTTSAVKEFQSSQGLTVDGVVGPKTWTALAAGGAQPPPPKPVALTKVTVAVLDEKSSDPIGGASVKLGGKSGKTNGAGEVKFELAAGTYPFSVTAEGFVDVRGEREVADEIMVYNELMVAKGGGSTERNVTVSAVDESTNEPIGNAAVKVGGKSGKTNASGEVKFKLAPGTYPYSVVAQGFDDGRGELEVTDDQDTNHIEFLASRGGGLVTRSVTVSAADEKTSKAIVGAAVKLGRETGKTNKDGEVKFVLPPGTYALSITAEGFESGKGELEVTADEDVNHVEFMVAKGGGAATERSVTVAAVDEKTTKPIAGATVKVGSKSAKTDGKGEVKFTLPPGKYPLSVTASGFEEGKSELEVTADEDANHVEFLASNAKTGTALVTASDETTGQGIQGATVKIGSESLDTGSIGLAVFVMPPGSYPYSVSAKGYQEARGTIEVELGGSTELIELLKPADSSGSVIFTVADETSGKTIEGAEVDIGGNTAKTSNVGFVVFFMPAGTYPYTVTAKGFAEAKGTLELKPEGELRMLELLAPAGGGAGTGSLTVMVSDQDTGAPIDDAKVEIDGESASTVPGSLGLVTFVGLKTGKHSYRVTADGHASASGVVDVAADSAQTPPLKVQLKSTGPKPAITLGELTVEVVFSDNGAPAKGAVVTVDPPAVAPAPSVEVCDAKGIVNFDGLRPGKCTATAKTATATAKVVVTITEGTIELAKIVLPRAKPAPKPGAIEYEPGEAEASINSPGLIEKTPSGFLLYNFGVNKSFVKPEHQKFLTDLVKKLRLDDPGSENLISVISGFTDAVDVEARNANLRRARADTVQTFLETHGAAQESVGVIRNTPAGNFLAANTTRQGRARNRSVTINLASQPIEPVPPTPKPQPKSTKSTKWALQSNLTASLPAKPGVSVQTVNFILHDKQNRKKWLLQFTGFGGGFGLGFPASVALPAPTDFETAVPCDPEDFNGGGAIRSANIGVGIIGFSLGEAQLHVTTKPAQIDISGFQFSFGADISFIGGQWKILG